MYTDYSGPKPPTGILGTEVIELQALYEIARLIGSAHHIDATLAKILQVLHEILRMERATLVVFDEGQNRLTIRASYGLTEQEKKRGVYRLDEGVCGKVFQTRSPFVVPDIHSEPLFLNKTGARKIIKEKLSFIGVPVLISNQPVGVLTVDRLFGLEISFEEDVRFLTVVAMLIAQFLTLNRAIARKEASLREENLLLKEQLQSKFNHRNMIGQSKVMQDVFTAVEKVADSSATVLLLGESGTGKELVARAIHQESARRDEPFIKVNCASLPDNLLESELLGHEKGAFTGALNQKKGRFELADGGTLFLDEIGELPLGLQAKLLRVLQERQFERLGGTRTISVDVRVLAATNRSLDEEVAAGNFRADLYYRLNVVPIMLPPLRNRKEDLPLLIEHFLRDSNSRNNRQVLLSREVLAFLESYAWPGNVRELQNLIERLVIMADGTTAGLNELPAVMRAVPESEDLTNPAPRKAGYPSEVSPPGRRSLEDLEKEEVINALSRNAWIQVRAARELGLTRRQLGYRIKKYKLVPPRSFDY